MKWACGGVTASDVPTAARRLEVRAITPARPVVVPGSWGNALTREATCRLAEGQWICRCLARFGIAAPTFITGCAPVLSYQGHVSQIASLVPPVAKRPRPVSPGCHHSPLQRGCIPCPWQVVRQ